MLWRSAWFQKYLYRTLKTDVKSTIKPPGGLLRGEAPAEASKKEDLLKRRLIHKINKRQIH